MYSRMMMASKRLVEAEASGLTGEKMDYARQALYRAQCNCPYWHGAFGGIYLPHLRNAIFNQIIACENLLDEAAGKSGGWVEATVEDYNFDLRQEVRLANDRLIALLAPAQGGHLYELDVRTICHNLGATFTRRPEAYHEKIIAGANQGKTNVASISNKVVFKQPGLENCLQYDSHPRKSLVDHFYEGRPTLEQVRMNEATEVGGFVSGIYEAKIRRAADRVQVQLSRPGHVLGHDIKVTKGVTLVTRSSSLEIVYLLENLPPDVAFNFGVEFNFAGLPSGASDRYFHDLGGRQLGQLGSKLDLYGVSGLGLVDEWLGIDVQLSMNRPSDVWTFPIETVSQSEGGFELVHQSVSVQPHWIVRGDASGRWSVTMTLNASTLLAEQRMQPQAAEAVS